MMMTPHDGVVAGGGAGMAGLGDEAGPHESLQHSVDRGAGNAGQAAPDHGIDLIRGGVVAAKVNGLEHRPPLNSQGQPMPAALFLEMQHLRSPRVRHSVTNGIMYQKV